MKKINILSVLMILTLIISFPMTAKAEEPYDVYNYDRWGEAIPSQAGYIAERSISGEDLDVGHFNAPNDIFRDKNNIFYVADSGNNRIIAVNSEFTEAVKIYDSFIMPDGSETELKNPTGIFVSEKSRLMYIADNENERVLVADTDGRVELEITKPESEIFDSKKTFLPQKVTADKAGNIYVVLGNITTGAAMFSSDGDFLGFYGANRVEPTVEVIGNYFLDIFRSDEKKARRKRNVPSGITNFDVYGDFIFTCTSSSTQKTDTVKKLNSAGNNIFYNLSLTFGDYISMYDSNTNTKYETKICDIDVADDGNINVLDYTTGRIFQYDEDCKLLFITGTIARQLGGFEQPASLETMGNDLYVLDSQKNSVTVFTETSFGRAVHEASSLYNKGYYEEALEPWYEVLKRDGNYRPACIGIASGLLNKGDYKGSMKYAKLAGSSEIYNKAFEGYRKEFLDRHFSQIVEGTAVLLSAWAVFRKIRRRSSKKEGSKSA